MLQPLLPNELMQRLVEPRFLLAMRKKLSGASDGALALPKMNSRLLQQFVVTHPSKTNRGVPTPHRRHGVQLHQ